MSFVDAKRIFECFTLDVVDDRFDYGEERVISLGIAGGVVVPAVAYTERQGAIRIISPRPAKNPRGNDVTKRYNKALTLEEIAAVPDGDIDTDDKPELGAEFWANATVEPPRTKPNISLRVDDEVVVFFKADNPKGYTARMAAVLTAYMRAHQSK